jgi:hypothetical protein
METYNYGTKLIVKQVTPHSFQTVTALLVGPLAYNTKVIYHSVCVRMAWLQYTVREVRL